MLETGYFILNKGIDIVELTDPPNKVFVPIEGLNPTPYE